MSIILIDDWSALHMPQVRTTAFLVACCAAATLNACSSGTGSSAGATGSAATTGATLSVVASTNVWGSVAQSIAGDHAIVTSIISDPSADPHSYQADARTELTLSKA